MDEGAEMTEEEFREYELNQILVKIIKDHPVLDPGGSIEKENAIRNAIGDMAEGFYASGFNDGILNVVSITEDLLEEGASEKVKDELERRYGWDAATEGDENSVETVESDFKDLLINLGKEDAGDLN